MFLQCRNLSLYQTREEKSEVDGCCCFFSLSSLSLYIRHWTYKIQSYDCVFLFPLRCAAARTLDCGGMTPSIIQNSHSLYLFFSFFSLFFGSISSRFRLLCHSYYFCRLVHHSIRQQPIYIYIYILYTMMSVPFGITAIPTSLSSTSTTTDDDDGNNKPIRTRLYTFQSIQGRTTTVSPS